MKKIIKDLLELNNISFKASLKNYGATLIGLFFWISTSIILLNYWESVKIELGLIAPILLLIIMGIIFKTFSIIPKPITTYEQITIQEFK